MGALHAGHLSLVRECRRRDATTVVSIFVNPTQFGPTEDLSTYPRDEERDLALLRAEGVHHVFMPDAAEVYPAGFETYVEVICLTRRLEGASRPGHFRGVTTVVCKLLNVVRPDRAYFGRKDAQQLRVVRRMVDQLNIPTEVVPMPVVRDPDGLALSSRNVRLSPDERRAALSLSAGLRDAAALVAGGERRGEAIIAAVERRLRAEPLVRVDYVSLADDGTLEELTALERRGLLSVAAFVGVTRLIDNLEVDPPAL